MSTVLETSPQRERRALYGVVAGVLVALLVIALVTYRSGRTSRTAEAKAEQLRAALQQEGLRSPSQDVLVRVLGDDGGAVCQNPGQALNKASLLAQLTNGAAGPGARPVIADARLVRGEQLVIQVYCPDQLADFQKVVDGLDLSVGLAGQDTSR